MTSKNKATTVARKQARAIKQAPVAPVVAPVVVNVEPDTIVNVAPKGYRTIVAIARELGLNAKNARRILRDMKAKKQLGDYDHTKGNRHFLSPSQEKLYVARIMSRRVES